ncbi:helix-turn-helix domain-containing protein [Streptococcus sp. DD12]|uniref:helix-turn-helix domain-containing protein n=1 Tax=Streptococcus sp. DD12 TaxID=1777880 RepID=UPI000AA2EA97
MLNIDEVLRKKNISIVDIADFLGVRSQTVSDKINGVYDFKFREAKAIQREFFSRI